MIDQAVSYASEREQFGRKIGSFQAVKHHCANMAIAARNARDQVGFASVAVEQQLTSAFHLRDQRHRSLGRARRQQGLQKRALHASGSRRST